jgi:hypothetical protein
MPTDTEADGQNDANDPGCMKTARTKSAQNCFLYCLVPATVASAFVFQID